MLHIKRDTNQQALTNSSKSIVNLHFVKSMNNFRSPEIVDRVSETQFQMSGN